MMDHTGKWILPMNDSNNNSNSDDAASLHQPMVTVITSPGVPSQLLKNIDHDDDHDDRPPLCLVETQEEDAPKETILVCQGATLQKTENNSDDDATTRTCLAVCGRLSNVLVMEGITTGDLVASGGGILSTRHARTLSYLFQSSSSSPVPTETTQPTLLLTVVTTTEDDKEQEEDSNDRAWDPEALLQDIRTLFQVVATSSSSSLKLEDVYNVQIVPISSTQVRLGNL